MLRLLGTTVAIILFASTASALAQQQHGDEKLQGRYRLCMDKAAADFLEEFKSSCDVLCIRQRHGNEDDCRARHTKWNTANCTLSAAETDRQELHLETARDRCLNEFKAGITAPP